MGTSRQVKALNVFIGQRMRAIREAQGKRQEDVVVTARAFGLKWTQATVAALETAKRQLNVSEFLLLPRVFGIELRDLFVGDQSVRLPTGVLTKPKILEAIVSSRAKSLRHDELLTQRTGTLRRALRQYRKAIPSLPLPPPMQDQMVKVWTSLLGIGVAEAKAARKFRVREGDIAHAAVSLWKRSLTLERDSRLAEALQGAPASPSPRTVQAMRGHITRSLLEVLRSELQRSATAH
jgi:transcriptional regulator with XRE-family HTH domain